MLHRLLSIPLAALLAASPVLAQGAPRIGPTFGGELVTAGCNQGVSWDPSAGTLNVMPGVDPACPARVLAAHDPTRRMPRAATAKQVRYALNDLGVRSAWNAAVAASSQGAQDYWTSADPMVEDNAKVAKWCAAAGITPAALFDKAVTE